jgi:hypothetical protein
MLDPAFGYRLEHEDTFTESNELAERYHVLWCAYVDARLVRRGLEPLGTAEMYRLDLARALPTLSAASCAELLMQVWNAAGMTHADLCALARHVEMPSTGSPRPGARCPLCRFPTFDWAKRITPELGRAIRADFPNWALAHGACARCVERYEMIGGAIYA